MAVVAHAFHRPGSLLSSSVPSQLAVTPTKCCWHGCLASHGIVVNILMSLISLVAIVGQIYAESIEQTGAALQIEDLDAIAQQQLLRGERLLDTGHWQDAVKTLLDLATGHPDFMIFPTEQPQFDFRTAIPISSYVERMIASSPQAVAAYRRQVDPLARRWYREGVDQLDAGRLWRLVREMFLASACEEALEASADLALERGDYARARYCWRRMHRRLASAVEPVLPQCRQSLASTQAKLALVSVLAGQHARARREISEIEQDHPDARGWLAGQEDNYARRLRQIVRESNAWRPRKTPSDWPTFLGNAARTGVGAPIGEVQAEAAWSVELEAAPPQVSTAVFEPDSIPFTPDFAYEPVGCHPIIAGRQVYWIDGTAIRGVRLEDGQPISGPSATLYRFIPTDACLRSRTAIG